MPIIVIKVLAVIGLLIGWSAVLGMSKAVANESDKEKKGLFAEGTLLSLLFCLMMILMLIKG